MAIQFDLIIPPIIVGILTITLFNLQTFMMETSVDNRLTNDQQTLVDASAVVLQQELRFVNEFVAFTPDSLRFVTTNLDTVGIKRTNREIEITRYNQSTATRDTTRVGINLTALDFTLEPQGSLNPQFIRFRIESESLPQHHVRRSGDERVVRAYAERRLLLRNVAVRQNQ